MTHTDSVLAERERIRTIITAPEARGREAVAHALAFDSATPAAEAVEAMKKTPAQAAPSQGPRPFLDAASIYASRAKAMGQNA